jgi:hypothetical protein
MMTLQITPKGNVKRGATLSSSKTYTFINIIFHITHIIKYYKFDFRQGLSVFPILLRLDTQVKQTLICMKQVKRLVKNINLMNLNVKF